MNEGPEPTQQFRLVLIQQTRLELMKKAKNQSNRTGPESPVVSRQNQRAQSEQNRTYGPVWSGPDQDQNQRLEPRPDPNVSIPERGGEPDVNTPSANRTSLQVLTGPNRTRSEVNQPISCFNKTLFVTIKRTTGFKSKPEERKKLYE